MSIELPKQKRTDAVASLQRYFEENLPELLGDLPAGYCSTTSSKRSAPPSHQAIHDAQTRLTQRVADLDVDELQYWAKKGRRLVADPWSGSNP